ncbi:DUF309 domain-containing protein [Roseobacter sp. YSTF-M11]|uniref:DUF309 domain-containing protein n=1 Tax=Roseobacter insulae TaxID=2859783 RepID=A0A9X1K384_9RHOB|nr:DUF309 domain-containing protein [Roseobacter insulae]MBW4709318.1 DUF309 domain-containing protein [Roseobacter insulae]
MSRSPEWPDGVPVPPHLYVPGKTRRHPEDWFDDIKASVSSATPVRDLHETQAFRAGIAYLDAGFFWECHEVLEAVWMRTQDPSPERDMVQALIQLANAQLKVLMGRPRASLRLCDMVDAHLQRCPAGRLVLGVAPEDIRSRAGKLRNDVIDAL